MPGPPPIPKELKVVRDTLRPSRELPDQLQFQPLAKIPRPPKHLDKRAKKEWKKICSNLIAVKMLYLVDLPQLQAYCFQVSIMEQAEVMLSKPIDEESVDESNLIITQTNNDGHQYKAKNKWISIYNEALDRVNKLGREFGFSPSARTRISMIKPGQDNIDNVYLAS